MRTTAAFTLLAAVAAIPIGTARAGEAAKALVKEYGLKTYTVTRKDSDFYEVLEGYVIKTKYCYTYVYYGKAVITESKIIFVDQDDVCDVEGIYRK